LAPGLPGLAQRRRPGQNPPQVWQARSCGLIH
jgi:hypothetical protein